MSSPSGPAPSSTSQRQRRRVPPAARATGGGQRKATHMIERMVLFGASGDLTSRLLMPASRPACRGRPPPREVHGPRVGEHRLVHRGLPRAHRGGTGEARHGVALHTGCRGENARLQPADVTNPDEVARVVGGQQPETLVYLALPPFLLESVLPALAATDLNASDAVAIEKPFGTDRASAQRLNEILRIHFAQTDDLPDRPLPVQRAGPPSHHPQVPQPHLRADPERGPRGAGGHRRLESLTLEGRASYYDSAGAMKDMVQNHLMEAMARC